MGSAFVVCKKCGKLIRLGEQRLATNKKFYCRDCYKLVEENSAARLVKIAEELPTTKELRSGKDKDDNNVKVPKKSRKKAAESGDSPDEI